MHALSCVLALSLALGPAAASADEAAAPSAAPALPDVEDDPAAQPVASTPASEQPAAAAPEAESQQPAAAEPASPSEPPPPSIEPEPEPGGDELSSTPAAQDRLGCSGSKACRNMSITGIVVGSLGVIGVAAGIGLLVNPDTVDAQQPIYIHSTRPPGLVSVTICSGFVLTSVLMVVAAHRGYKQGEPIDPKHKRRAQLHGVGVRF